MIRDEIEEMKKQKVDVVIRYEHKVRELESIMLIKLEMERRGYSVAFTANYDYHDKRRIDPRLIVSPAIYGDNQLLIDIFRYGLKKKFVNLLWEQVVGIKEEESPDGYHNVYGTAQRIETICWGNNTKRRLVAAGMNEKCAKVVGQLNTDLLRSPFAKNLCTKHELAAEYGIDSKGRWNLFVSSFSYCALDNNQKETIIRIRGKKYLNEFALISEQSREQILQWFEQILLNYPEDILIYRPHPDEAKKSQKLKDLEIKYSNFRVIADLSMKQWVNACDKIYNWYSTGIIDAYILKKPIRLLRPFAIPKEYDYRLYYNANQIKTIDAFLEDYPSMDLKEGLDEQVISDYYHIPKRPVYMEVCDLMEEMLKSDKYDIHFTIKEYRYFIPLILRRKIIDSFEFLEPVVWKLHLFKGVIGRRDQQKKDLDAGFNRNVATNKEIEELSSQLKPFIYGNN